MKPKNKVIMPDPQLDGGPDLDTTNLDQPAGLEQTDQTLIGDDLGEHGPMSMDPSLESMGDPSGDDPFIAGTGETDDGFDPDSLLSDRERDAIQMARQEGAGGPTYEANQGNIAEDHGGSTDPNNDLTEDTSGYQRE